MNLLYTFLRKIKVFNELFFGRVNADPRILGVFRICFSLVALGVAISSTLQIELIWYPHVENNYYLYLLLHLGWIASLLLLLSGRLGRWASFIHYIFAFIVLNYENSGNTMEDNVYMVTALWTLFIDISGYYRLRLPTKGRSLFFNKESGPVKPVNAWPVLFLGLNFGLIFCGGGINKFLDPFWHNGYGVYYAMYMPWIKPSWLDFMLDWKYFLMTLNYLIIAGEIFFVLLFLFRKTRPFALLVLFLFFFGLVFPLRVDYIGPLGLCMFLLLLSVDKTGIRIFSKLFMKKSVGMSLSPNQDKYQQASPMMLVRMAGVAMMLLMFTNSALKDRIVYPVMYYPKTYINDEGIDIKYKGDLAEKYISFNKGTYFGTVVNLYHRIVNMRTTKIQRISVFNSVHTAGVYNFRVKVKSADGTEYETFKVFNENGTAAQLTGFLSPRWLQARMYFLGNVYLEQLLQNPADQRVITQGQADLLMPVVHFALSRYKVNEAAESVHIYLSLNPTPETYVGSERNYEVEWKETFVYDLETKTFECVFDDEVPQLRIQTGDSKGGIITYDF